MKALVTGGAGFIGSHIVDRLRALGADVICVDSLDPQVFHAPPPYLRDDVDYVFADLRHWEPDSRVHDVEFIVHLAALGGVTRAAREPANIIGGNCTGTARLLDAARRMPRLRRVVLAGSFSVYGAGYRYRCPRCGAETDGHRSTEALDRGEFDVACPRCGSACSVLPITEDVAPSPLETYAASKYMQELCFRGFDNCPATIFRFSSVYGPRLRLDDGEATIIAKLAGWIRGGVSPKLFEDGRQVRDWVHVGDVACAVEAVAAGAAPPPVVNVCSGVPTTLQEACAVLSGVMGVDVPPQIIGGYRPGDMRACLGDTTRLAALLGRAPRPFREGAALTFGDRPSRQLG